VQVWLEIRPESSKLRLSNLVPTGQAPDTRWVEVFTKLFVDLGFDDDGEEEQNPPFRGRNFRAEELVANLIDYQDRDSESQPLGIERDLPEGTFANSHIRDINELRAIPGFTPNRIRRLMPYVTAVGEQRVNVNFAPPLVLRALHDSMTDPVVAQIVAFREGPDGPIETHAQQATLTNFISNDDYSELSPLIDTRSNWFQVVAKVEYVGAARYYLRATVFREGTGTLPIITSVELY
jgi:type II secretory pathway component PulK